MRKVILTAIVALFLTHCSPLKGVSTEGLTHQGKEVYYNGELAARLSAVELAYDGGKIVKEVTFIIVDSKFNDLAIPIIAFVREHTPNAEVEVELKQL